MSLEKKIELKDGIISFDNLTWLKDNNQVKMNVDFLTEDLLQINFFCDRFIIDVGWYPSTSKKGCFTIMLIKNQDWTKPLFISNTRNLFDVYKYINICIKIIYKKNHL
ncbi:hypothetical protein [Acinetobacter equi]|uniref:Uncharacterized protein n=1 Tax=Acinetobacter equi TaxID=1324350 RepID=A0A0N9W1V5_9GAMM|nr:hypothetical protein [Acinetobacter equi]ALH95485.1 hypothetical protein AOY20_08055 [Acinetobacter equi]